MKHYAVHREIASLRAESADAFALVAEMKKTWLGRWLLRRAVKRVIVAKRRALRGES